MADLGLGQTVPYFELPDQQDYPWGLSGQLEVGPVVLVFYRGDWCPYCNGQLAGYARGYEEFDKRGAQVAGISVDPPGNNARMVGELLLPFPLLSDPRGELIKRYGLWDEEEGVAAPSILVVDRSGEIRYRYSGSDFADRPGDEEVFAALDGLDSSIQRLTGGSEFRVTAEEARESVRPDKRAMTLEELLIYYRGVFRATVVLKKRFGGGGRSGREALKEVSGDPAMVQGYREGLPETVELHGEEG